MTLTTTPPKNNTPRSIDIDDDKPKRKTTVVGIAVLALLIAAAGAWHFVIREVAPVEVDSVEAAAARSEAAAEAGAQDAETLTVDDISGVWNVDTSIGQFNDSCLTDVCASTFAGFRIDEVLSGIGDKTVVGRTPGVEGQIVVDGTTVTGGEFIVDMTGLITDSSARTGAIRNQAIETGGFPTATFELTSELDFGDIPGGGEQVTVTASGNLTVHGVTQAVEMPLTAELQNGVIVVFGQLELALADYGIDTPSAPVVVSVDDFAVLELQLFLTR